MIGAVPALYAVVRGLIYIALLLLVGAQCARALIAATLAHDLDVGPAIRDRTRRLAAMLVPGLLVLVLIRGALQVGTLLDPGDSVTADMVTAVLRSGPWGHAWQLQLAAIIALFIVLRLRAARAFASVLPVCLIIGVILWAQTGMGHAATDRWIRPFGRLLDGIHLVGAGIWLGTLGVLAVAALPMLRREARLTTLARLVRTFSIYARTGVVLVLVSGIVAALVYAGSIDAFLASRWGRLLLIKLGCVAGVLVLGWYNWRILTPALDTTDPKARARLNLAVRVELALALTMLAITALLVVSPLPDEG